MIEILKRISINPFFWPVIIGALLTGQFIEIITLFGIVIIHELGHVFTAKSYGWDIIEIELLPFGGVAKAEQKSDSVREEFIVAIAGPLQNFMMIFVALGFKQLGVWSNDWATFFIHANLWIGLFNLLPISPLDGSKILKTLLYLFFSFRKAMMISFFSSFVMALFFLLWSSGILLFDKVNMNGLVLSVFFIYTNWMEVRQVPYFFWKFLLQKANAAPKRNVPAVPIILKQDTPVIHALYLLRKERYHLFYLISEQGELVKILPEEKVLKNVLKEKEIYQPIDQLNV